MKGLIDDYDTRKPKGRAWTRLAVLILLAVAGVSYITNAGRHLTLYRSSKLDICSQATVLYPSSNEDVYKSISDVLVTDEFEKQAIEWLGGAVRVPTESYDGMKPVGVDPRWEPMGKFHDYLKEAFPKVHATLHLQKINTYGLLFEWTGTDTSLKPLLLMAHMDVVPVHPNTVSEWVHPPYSGYYDGELIWGRGSSDDKSGLIGIMSTIEALLSLPTPFIPTRSVVLSFGFDEEISGYHGAAYLAEAVLEKYGQDSMAFIVDEGGGFAELYGTIFATPGTAEKGYMDTLIEIAAPGGHSSVPPAHTSIGMLSAMIVAMEKDPYPLSLSRSDVLYDQLQCYSAHGSAMPKKLKKAIQRATKGDDKGLREIENTLFGEASYASLVRTTQAIDLINGGVKTNALPEQAWAMVNHRISTRSSVAEVQARDTLTILPIAKEMGLEVTAFGTKVYEPEPGKKKGTVSLSKAYNHSLEPAPRTPTTLDSAAWSVLSGTIKATFEAHRTGDMNVTQGVSGDDIVVSPGMPTGNTDTKYYWKLSDNIFRYNHKNSFKAVNRLGGVHTTNENIEVAAFMEMIRFFAMLILNTDESDL